MRRLSRIGQALHSAIMRQQAGKNPPGSCLVQGGRPGEYCLGRQGVFMWQGKDKEPGKGKARESNEEARKYLDPAHQASRKKPTELEIAGGSGISRLEREAALNKQILVYHESQPADTGLDWMYRLKEESMKCLGEQRGVQQQEIYRECSYKKGIEK